ncbi:MAG: AsmA family protein [Candidatus Omnitrophica bacterium]|nr:AsmA family protein [Candidatus Omnitrophota bacterium]MDD5553135.1 AsmA family protein [Candidatus Omnitrophota bacterium]
MKKGLKVVSISLLSLCIVLYIGIFIFLKTFDFNRLKPQIIIAGQNALGRPVDFTKIDLKLSFRNGIQLRLSDIKIGEDPEFGRGDFLTAKEFNFDLSVKELLFKRQIRISGAGCKDPILNIVRLKDGRINAQAFGLGTQASPRVLENSTDIGVQSSAASAVPASAIPEIFVNRVDIDNGKLTYIDHFSEPEVALVFDGIALRLDDFSLAKAFPIALKASFASDSQNIAAQGKGQVNISRPSFILKDVKATGELSNLSMEALRRFIPQLKSAPLPEIRSGILSASIDLFEAGPEGLIALKGRGALAKGSLKMKELAVPVERIEAGFTMTESAITLDNASFSLGKGKIAFSAGISDYLLAQNYSAKANFENIDLSESMDQSAYPIKVKGIVSGNIKLSGQGFDPNTMLSKLNGNGSIDIKEGQLTDINVMKMVLDKLPFFPNLAGVLEEGLPDRFKGILRKKDTDIASFKSGLEVINGKIQIRPVDLEAESFIFQGEGSLGFDRSYSLFGAFVIPRELSAGMIEDVPQMEYLLDEAKQIRFPLRVSGKGASVSFVPDVKQMGADAIRQRGMQELEKVFDKIWGKEQ